MVPKPTQATDVRSYIAGWPAPVQKLLRQLRATIRKAAPDAVETISYRMPAFEQNGPLVYFAAYAHHIGFYPTGSGIEAFKHELNDYRWSRGAVQFPLDRPLPLALVTKMVKHRVKVNKAKAEAAGAIKRGGAASAGQRRGARARRPSA